MERAGQYVQVDTRIEMLNGPGERAWAYRAAAAAHIRYDTGFGSISNTELDKK